MEQTHTATVGDCAACGTSPVNHTLTYCTAIMDDTLSSTMGFLVGWIRVPREGTIANYVSAGLIGFFRILGLARFNTDKTKAASGRSELIWNEADRRSIEMQQAVIFGKYLEQYRARINGRWIYFQSIPIPHWLPQAGYDWMDDKFKLAKKLNEAGVAAPKARHATTWHGTKKAFEKLDKPVIIKPRSGSRGRHTTTNINTEAELHSAYTLGKMIAPSLVIEEHLFGSVYRATVVDNKLVGFFRADPPRITGDGTRTIRELVEKKNRDKNADPNLKEKIGDVQINDDLVSFIGRYGYALESVVPLGTTLDLSAKTGRFYGGYTREMLPEVHPKLHDIFKKAGETVQVAIVGFDLIIEDPKKDPDTQKWGIIEANSLPFIDLHYFALEGEPVDIAKDIWNLWEKKDA